MQKIVLVKVLVLFILINLVQSPVGTQLNYEDQICPLAKHNIEVAENSMIIVQNKLDEALREGLDITEAEAILVKATELLQTAKKFNLQNHNCIMGNMYAIRAIKLLEKSLEIVEAKLNILKEEEYAVYRALLNEGYHLIEDKYSRDEIQMIVIIDHTYGCESYEDLSKVLKWVGQKMPLTEQETLDNFQLRNEESHRLGDYFDLSVEVVLVSIEEIREIFQEDNGWEEFYATYPFSQGTMTLSRVGFNTDMDQALLYVEFSTDYSIGGAYYILFTKENGVWTLQNWIISLIY